MKIFITLQWAVLWFCGAFFNRPDPLLKVEFIYPPNAVDFPSCHASTLTECHNGTLLAAWFGGTYERHQDVCIYASRYVKGQWSTPEKIADGAEDGTKYPCWNPVLFSLDNGTVALYYKVGPNPRSWWGLYKTSTDHGQSWSPAVRIPDNLLGPIKNKPIRLLDGNILYPTSFETDDTWNIYLEYSDQNLSQWKKAVVDNSNTLSIQPTILKHNSNQLQLLCRSQNGFITESWSEDGGTTWTPLALTNLPNNNAGIDAVSLSDGRFLLVHTPLPEGRHKLIVSLSKDGKNWQEAYVLENDQPGTEYSYPAVIQTKDNLVHITYTWRRQLIKHVVLSPQKI